MHPHNWCLILHKTETLYHISDIAASLQLQKKKFWREWLLWRSSCPKTATKTSQFFFNLQALDWRAWKLRICLVRKLRAFHGCNNEFYSGIELKCCVRFTPLSEGLVGFWLWESLDSLLNTSRWITDMCTLRCKSRYLLLFFADCQALLN